jgi:hypothetical protein
VLKCALVAEISLFLTIIILTFVANLRRETPDFTRKYGIVSLILTDKRYDKEVIASG